RQLRRGEPVVAWFAGVSRRYHVTSYRTLHLGEPGARFSELYGAAESALRVIAGEITIGGEVAVAARKAAAAMAAGGYDRYQVARWGYGVGIAYPPVWLEGFDLIEESTDTFQPGTLMCLHVCLSSMDDGFGMYVGGDYLLTDDGVEALDELGPSLIVR